MRDSSFNLQNLAVMFAFVVMGALGWQAKHAQDALLEANASVARSLEVITAIRGTLSALQDIETGMRGYALTGDDAFLEPYHSGKRRLREQRRLIDENIQPSAERRVWLANLDEAMARRVALADRIVVFRRTGTLDEVALHIRNAGGRQAMDRVRRLMAELEAHERAVLQDERQAVEHQAHRTQQLAVGGGITAVLLLLAALVSVNRNLQARARLLARAQAGEERQKAMLRAIPDTLWLIEPTGTMHSLSATVERGRELPDGLAASIARGLDELDPREGAATFGWQGRDATEYEIRLVSVSGGDRLAIVRDVTDAARNRRELADRQAFLRNIVDTDENLIFVRDATGRFVLCNVAFSEVTHRDPSQLEGVPPDVLPDISVIAPLLQGDQALLRGEQELRQEQVRIVDSTGVERWFQMLKRPLELSDGQRLVLTVAVDISTRLRMERMKGEFISTVSHELRTPLTSIRGALGMLIGGMAGELPEASRPLLDIAHNNTERLVRLINDILDIEKLEAGRLQLQLAEADVGALVVDAVEQNRPYAEQFGIQLRTTSTVQGRVEVDIDRFAQIMANILSNAVKHSPAGATVDVQVGHEKGGFTIEVVDRGEGIPEEFRARMFERFAQADGSNVRRTGGTGLGLSITRSLVEQMGGRIGFDSIVGEGTTFRVWLPEAASGTGAAPAEKRRDGPDARTRILLVQNESTITHELVDVLSLEGYSTQVAQGLEEARRALDDGGISAAVIDLALPGGAGPAFVRELRSQARFQHLPLLLFATDAADDEGLEGLSGGAVGVVNWLLKPLSPERVAAAVSGCLRGTRGKPAVLHVEDDADVRTLVSALLGGQSVVLDAAEDLASARAALAARHYDLVILDLMLPDGDGAELLPGLGASLPPTPVIIFSAQDRELPESRIIMHRLVKSRSGAAELAALITHNLRHWPAGRRQKEAS